MLFNLQNKKLIMFQHQHNHLASALSLAFAAFLAAGAANAAQVTVGGKIDTGLT